MTWTSEAVATMCGASATLITGVAAVIAALIVGLRQVNIQRKQTAITNKQAGILERQVSLDELSLRANLFDKRYAVYKATSDIVVQALSNRGRPPAGDTIERNFLSAKDQATFLFRPSVAVDLQELWAKVIDGQTINAEMAALYGREGHYGEFSERDLENNRWLAQRFETLSEIFGAELRLSNHDVQLG